MNQPFLYNTLRNQSFRLLHLDAISDDCRLKYRLITYDLESPPTDDAISYSWNSERPSVPIICNEKRLSITPSLHAAFQAFHRTGHIRPVWADGICINQSDDAEKAQQVSLMGSFYSEAQTVLVWLGPQGHYTDIAIKKIRDLSKSMEVIEEPFAMITDTLLQEHGLPASTDLVWEGIREIFQRNWFKRLWILQEVALAKQILIYCGASSMNWGELEHLAEHIARLKLRSLVRGDGEIVTKKMKGGDGVMLPNFVRFFRENRAEYALHELCHTARSRNTSEPIGKAYALLGMTHESVRSRITIDYSPESRRNYWKAYVALGIVSLNNSPLLGMLQIAASQERPPGLPTWCPNLNSVCPTTMLNSEFYNTGIVIDNDKDWAQNSFLDAVPDTFSVRLRGIKVDEVAEVITPTLWWDDDQITGADGCAAKCSHYIKLCRALAAKLFPLSHDSPEELARTLICNISFFPIVFAPTRDTILKMLESTTMYLKIAEVSVEITHLPMLNRSWQLMQKYLAAMIAVCHERRFFATKQGRIGLGPSHTEAGDLIFVFKNARLPFIFRQKPTGGSSELVGEAYVHGIMNGEVLRKEWRGREDESVIVVS